LAAAYLQGLCAGITLSESGFAGLKDWGGFVFSLPGRLDSNHANPLILQILIRTMGVIVICKHMTALILTCTGTPRRLRHPPTLFSSPIHRPSPLRAGVLSYMHTAQYTSGSVCHSDSEPQLFQTNLLPRPTSFPGMCSAPL